MSIPTLYLFAISHYCEKARWALEYLGVEHRLEFVAPGRHMRVARALGLRRGSVPFLVTGDEVVQGSAAIVSWAEQRAPAGAPALSSDGSGAACLAIERRLDDVAGVHARRLFYSEAVVDHPGLVRPLLTAGVPVAQKLGFRLSWRLVRSLMIRGMDLGPAQRDESRDIVEGELAWIEEMLDDGREYLVDGRFSRADIAGASLLAPVALPEQHPAYAGMDAPPKFAADLARWGDRPALAWVREMYARHRRAGAASMS